MKRRDLLKGLGLVGLGTMLPLVNTEKAISKAMNAMGKTGAVDTCWLTPALTEGPYYINPNLFRQDITEGRPGMPLHMKINVINYNCDPVSGVLVDVWHADKDGNYSGFNGFVGQTFMRGIQPTNSQGLAEFDTVYPGWYQGRATHIHFKVRLTASTYVTSQFCFPDETNNTVYATPEYVGRGPNPTTNAADSIFHEALPQYLVMTATPNGNGGYDGEYTIGIDSPTSIGDPEVQPNEFALKQNYPNPFNPSTVIPYQIAQDSDVQLIIYNTMGQKVRTLVNQRQTAGSYEIKFNANGLSSGYYFYKLIAGGFVQTKEMLLIK
ncbi:MAG: T9SS type A sorting domain-containing protein [Ignavibacteriae bacterium]|nr:T9SS type A sorting domain-containing protein [Ignavibacteriota bacterium]